MSIRRHGGRETFDRLLNWDKGQTPSERLAAALLGTEGFNELDPSHPLGGKDGGKDILLKKNDDVLMAAVYFPRGQKSFREIKEKYLEDCEGIGKNSVSGIVFFTNQELRLAERKELQDSTPEHLVDIYHLERIRLLLDLPLNYGTRLEYLEVEMTHEETTAFLAQRDLEHFNRLTRISEQLAHSADEINNYITGGNSYPLYFMGPALVNNRIPFLVKVEGKYPLYDAQVSFQYSYTELQIKSIQENDVMTARLAKSTKADWTKCSVLSSAYSQLITHMEQPLLYPANVRIKTFARNSVFTQVSQLPADLDFIDTRITDSSQVELYSKAGASGITFN